jgi:hypothetical protein
LSSSLQRTILMIIHDGDVCRLSYRRVYSLLQFMSLLYS